MKSCGFLKLTIISRVVGFAVNLLKDNHRAYGQEYRIYYLTQESLSIILLYFLTRIRSNSIENKDSFLPASLSHLFFFFVQNQTFQELHSILKCFSALICSVTVVILCTVNSLGCYLIALHFCRIPS